MGAVRENAREADSSPIPPKGEHHAILLTGVLKERIAHSSDAVD
ncbi:hypothetical protein [Bradyrhizobium xenonodulans]|nr:hypothetical protein [Bradyrhizobium xenonodulans]